MEKQQIGLLFQWFVDGFIVLLLAGSASKTGIFLDLKCNCCIPKHRGSHPASMESFLLPLPTLALVGHGLERVWPRPVLVHSKPLPDCSEQHKPTRTTISSPGVIQNYSEWLMITANTCRQYSGWKRLLWGFWGEFRMHQKEGWSEMRSFGKVNFER